MLGRNNHQNLYLNTISIKVRFTITCGHYLHQPLLGCRHIQSPSESHHCDASSNINSSSSQNGISIIHPNQHSWRFHQYNHLNQQHSLLVYLGTNQCCQKPHLNLYLTDLRSIQLNLACSSWCQLGHLVSPLYPVII